MPETIAINVAADVQYFYLICFQTEDESDVLDYSMTSNTSSNSATPVKSTSQHSPEHTNPLSVSPGINTIPARSTSTTKSLLTSPTISR